MKKVIIIILCCLFLAGCQQKYQRISFDRQLLGEELAEHVDEKTAVVNNVTKEFATQLPIYQISKRSISSKEVHQMLENLGLPEYSDWHMAEHEGNRLFLNLVSYTDFSRGYFDMTDEELEACAWEVLENLPFIDDGFEYMGKMGDTTMSDSGGIHTTRVSVTFRRVLDDLYVQGEDECSFEFDGSGLVSINIRLFNYKNIGTMDVVSFDSAIDRVKAPDYFRIETTAGRASSLVINKVGMFWVNQQSKGCTILQPIFRIVGTASIVDGDEADFIANIIAIPESYTYEAPAVD